MSTFEKGSLGGKIAGGIVVDNNDPDKNQRIKYRIPALHTGREDAGLSWAMPFGWSSQGNTSGIGDIAVPVVGAKVAIFFPEDDEHQAYYLGDWHDKTTQIAELLVNYPNVYGRIDASGNLFLVDTQLNTVKFVHFSGSYIQFNEDGSGEVGFAAGVKMFAAQTINVKATGVINIDGSNVNINSGGAPTLPITPRTRPPATPFSNKTDH